MIIQCTQCGQENPPGKILCISCGASLHKYGAAKRKKEGIGLGKLVGALVKNILTLALLAIIVAAMWPIKSSVETNLGDSNTYLMILQDVDDTNEGVFKEEDLNTYLAEAVAANRADNKVNLTSFTIDLDAESTTLFMRNEWFIFPFTFRLQGRPFITENGEIAFEAHQAWMGHLPLPGPGKTFVKTMFARLVSGMEQEQSFQGKWMAMKINDTGIALKAR